MITTIVFDIGMVLLGFEGLDYLNRLFDETTARRVGRAMFFTPHWNELDRGVLSVEEIVQSFCSEDPEIEKEIKEAFYRIGECVEKRDWAAPLMDDLKERGYRLLFLSNMSEHVMGSKPEAFEFTDHMDGGIYSCHVNLIKPDPAIFRCLFERYGLTPSECLFIDDNKANIAAAGRLGMKTIRFRSREQLEADLGVALQKDAGHDRISVMCYGDSNTYGYDPHNGSRYPHDKRWTTFLGYMLGGRYEVIPAGLNGRTTAYDRPGAPWKNGLSSFAACIGMNKPLDYIVIMLGTNDCIEGMDLSAEEVAKGMESLVETAEEVCPGIQGYMPKIIVTAPPAMNEDCKDSPFAHDISAEAAKKSRDIAGLYREIAERHGCLFADANGVELSHDCMHISDNGQGQMAELIYNVIEGIG